MRILMVPRDIRHRTMVRVVGLGMAVTVALSLGLAPVSSADTAGDKQKVDAKIAQLSTAIEGTSGDLAKALLALQATKAALPGAQKALTAAAAAQVVADSDNRTLATALTVARANEAKAADALGQNARASQTARDQLGNLVRNDYQQGAVSGLSIALEATSPEDFTDRLIMLDTVMQVRRATLRGLDTMRAQSLAGQSHLLAVRRRVAALKVEAEASLARATAARKTAATAKNKLDQLYAAQAEYEATVAARKATEITNLAKLQSESDSLMRLLAARARAAREAAARQAASGGGSQSAPPRGPGQLNTSGGFLSLPLIAPVSSEFGMRFDPVMRVWQLHAGIDFAANCGSPVYAAASGDVILATPEGASGGYGNRLVIDHGLQRGVDLTTTYNHLTRWVVSSGHVSRGQLVAISGTTGFSTGCHLHFETRENGTPVNPRLWL
jgi:murein DD-endopeptidase MepM/ murein hydrolase activator NlpD